MGDDVLDAGRQHERRAGAALPREPQQRGHERPLRRVPSIHRVGVVRGEERELAVRVVELDAHGRRVAAQQRRHRRHRDVEEAEALPRLAHVEHVRRPRRAVAALESRRQVAPVGADQADGERDVVRRLVRLAGRRRARLRDVERVRVAERIVASGDAQQRRAGLRVPAAKLREVDARGVLHRVDEVVAGHRLAVVAREVEVHPAAERLGPEQRVLHADHLGALLVDGRRVEVVDLLVFVGTHRVGHRAGVLGVLVAAQVLDGGDALDRARAAVARELLVAEHGESFLERQLEPVAARDAVAGPVVEVLVPDDALDRLVVVVGGGVRVGEEQAAVEDVEPLVLHRAHVEVVGAEDHEAVEVVLAAEALLVPAHRGLQRLHRVAAARQVLRRRVDREMDRAGPSAS